MGDLSRLEAEKIIEFADQADIAIHKTLKIAEASLSDVEYGRYKLIVADIMVSIQKDMLRTIVEKYPELDSYGYLRNK